MRPRAGIALAEDSSVGKRMRFMASGIVDTVVFDEKSTPRIKLAMFSQPLGAMMLPTGAVVLQSGITD